nr:MerR family DNA-binding transcriptional regulator [Alysiella crassa]UOP06845.1 MerR family DNA-binding transcriptional regulator [Alysiella crassa]
MSKFFKIKQASEQTGVHLETIRYYEKQGLISPSSPTKWLSCI